MSTEIKRIVASLSLEIEMKRQQRKNRKTNIYRMAENYYLIPKGDISIYAK